MTVLHAGGNFGGTGYSGDIEQAPGGTTDQMVGGLNPLERLAFA